MTYLSDHSHEKEAKNCVIQTRLILIVQPAGQRTAIVIGRNTCIKSNEVENKARSHAKDEGTNVNPLLSNLQRQKKDHSHTDCTANRFINRNAVKS